MPPTANAHPNSVPDCPVAKHTHKELVNQSVRAPPAAEYKSLLLQSEDSFLAADLGTGPALLYLVPELEKVLHSAFVQLLPLPYFVF